MTRPSQIKPVEGAAAIKHSLGRKFLQADAQENLQSLLLLLLFARHFIALCCTTLSYFLHI